jgi:hypothetical protein
MHMRNEKKSFLLFFYFFRSGLIYLVSLIFLSFFAIKNKESN